MPRTDSSVLPYFNPRSLHGERPALERADPAAACNFNPRSLHGERHAPSCADGRGCKKFQSTLPARGATYRQLKTIYQQRFQSTLPARGATLSKKPDMIRRKISIHAPCTGSDGTRRACGCSCSFQSTLPARGATTSPTSSGKLTTYFNPRSLHGERLSGRLTSRRAAPISIHAPCTGSDRVCCTQKSTSITFQSTLPARGATKGTSLP